MVLLAKQAGDSPMTIPEIGKREGLSVPYVGKLLMILKQAELIKAVRGRNGGYILAENSEAIRLSRIFEALGEPLYSDDHCRKHTGDNEVCVHVSGCTVKPMWKSFDKFIRTVFDKVTLADLANGKLDISEIASEYTAGQESKAEKM